MVGDGKNLWPNVEIHERTFLMFACTLNIMSDILVADLYTTLYDKIISDADTGHGRNGFYFGANGEHSLYDVGKAIGKALVALGKSQSDEPTTFTQAELDKYFGVRAPYISILRLLVLIPSRALRISGPIRGAVRHTRSPLAGSPLRRRRIC
jgi:hypothetical protein